MQFKIRDNIDLDILLNYGYKKKFDTDTGEVSHYVCGTSYTVRVKDNGYYYKARYIEPPLSNEVYACDRSPIYSNWYVTQVLYKMIKDDIVEVVE